MHCDEVQPRLIDLVDASGTNERGRGTLSASTRAAVAAHLETCERCSDEYDYIDRWQATAQGWHDEAVPRWEPPRVASRRSWQLPVLQWFPVAASTLALALVSVMFFESRTAPTGGDTAGIPVTTNDSIDARLTQLARDLRQDWETRQAVDQSMVVQSVMEANRSQRALELEALVTVLKAEMNRQALDTQESLRYVINHQIEDGERLDQLSEAVRKIGYSEEGPSL